MKVLLACLFAATLTVASAEAQTAPDTENGRYQLNKVPEGQVRLDTRTGQVSLCSKSGSGWACQAVPDDRTAFENEITRLQNENARLKKEMLARGVPLPGGVRADTPTATNSMDLRLPNEADLDRMMAFIERVWRRLVDIVQSTPPVEKKS